MGWERGCGGGCAGGGSAVRWIGDYGTSSEGERSMARFMERFEQHMAEDPELRDEYERLGPRFVAVSAALRARTSVAEGESRNCENHSGWT